MFLRFNLWIWVLGVLSMKPHLVTPSRSTVKFPRKRPKFLNPISLADALTPQRDLRWKSNLGFKGCNFGVGPRSPNFRVWGILALHFVTSMKKCAPFRLTSISLHWGALGFLKATGSRVPWCRSFITLPTCGGMQKCMHACVLHRRNADT